jgi:hypothetical protein
MFAIMIGVPIAIAVYFKRNPKTHAKFDEIGGKVLSWTIGIAVGLWVLYAFFLAPSRIADDAFLDKPVATGLQDARKQIAAASVVGALGDDAARVQLFEGDNLVLFIHRARLDAVPFPDRERFVTQAAQSWCAAVDHLYLPTVTIKDIRTGDGLASYSCVTGHASLASGNGWRH